MGFLIVFLGSGIGGAMRHGVNLLAAKTWGEEFPFGTMAICSASAPLAQIWGCG
jgi:fluoride exporter